MSSYVKALYDFTGEPNTSELSITTGEVLSVTRTDVGEGWWEGKNSKGQVGLFPAAYVEVMSAAEVAQINGGGGGGAAAAAAAAVAAAAAAGPNQNMTSTTPSTIGAIPTSISSQLPRYDQTSDDWNDGQDDWEDDWDDDNDTYSEIGPASAAISGNQQQNNNIVRQSTFSSSVHQNNYANMNLPPTPSEDTLSMSGAPATVKRSGMFSKSGDSYILGMINIPVPEVEKAYIVQVEQGYSWQPVTQPYLVRVASPKKETKFKGMKSFIAYQLTPSFNNISVSRRYKHFDWLHERLVDKFCLIPIPPLPDKQISGRYEEQFIEHRRVQLQEFVDWMCRHPVLSKCEVWMHFLTCVDAKEWKSGKRAAEKDPLVGISYCSAIFPPEKQLLQSHVDQQMETCSNFVHLMDSAVKNLLTIAADQIKRNQIQSRKDFQRIGDGLADLSKALEIDERLVISSNPLSSSIGRLSGLLISIGQLFGEQPKLDWIPFSDRLHIYRGILGSFPDILNTHKSAMQKRKECERLAADQKMGNAQLVEVGRRTDIISYAVLAEVTHFRSEREEHLKRTMRNFIDAQIQFYQNIIKKLQEAQTQFQ